MCSAFLSLELKTPRLVLRAPRSEDAPRLAELANDYDVARMVSAMPYPYALADAEGFVEMVRAADPAEERAFAIEAEDEGVVGVVGLHGKHGGGAPEVGYWLGRPFWGRGYATEAARAATRWAHREWDRPYLIAAHFTDNPASGAVLCKAGFLYTGEVQNRFCKARGEEAPTRMMVRLA